MGEENHVESHVESWCNLLDIIDNNNPTTPSSLYFYLNSLEISKQTRKSTLASKNINGILSELKKGADDNTGRFALLVTCAFSIESAVFWDCRKLYPDRVISRFGDCILGMKLSGPISIKLKEIGQPDRIIELKESFELRFPYFFYACNSVYPPEIISGNENLLAVKWILINARMAFVEPRKKTVAMFGEVAQELKRKKKNLKVK